jgi:hypothetical protein
MRANEILSEATKVPAPKPGHVRLYRGDSAKIDSFETEKTSLYGLFGHGIYLTDSRRVAGDYMTKGTDTPGDVIFRTSAKTKQEVVQKYCRMLASKIDANGVDHSRETAYWSSTVEFSDGGQWGVVTNDLRKAEEAKRMAYAAEQWKKLARTYEVRVKLDGTAVIQKKMPVSNAGLAVFDVPDEYLRRVLIADATITRGVLNDLISVLNKFDDRATARDVANFVTSYEREDGDLPSFREVYTGIGADSPFIHNEEAHALFRRLLQADRITGIQYAGGITMGGGFKHHAYVFWDDKAVNGFRVA